MNNAAAWRGRAGPSWVTARAGWVRPCIQQGLALIFYCQDAGSSRAFRNRSRKSRAPGGGAGGGPASLQGRPCGQKLPEIKPRILTGVELEEKLDSVIIEVAAIQDDLDERGEAALPGCGH